MGEVMYTRKQLEDVIKQSVIMTRDFLSESDLGGAELFEKHKDHFKASIIP